MTVMMPVRCIGDICERCDKLNLDIDRYYYGGDIGTINNICCANVRACELIKQMVENEMKKEKQKHDHQD